MGHNFLGNRRMNMVWRLIFLACGLFILPLAVQAQFAQQLQLPGGGGGGGDSGGGGAGLSTKPVESPIISNTPPRQSRRQGQSQANDSASTQIQEVVVPEIRERIEFQDFVAQSTGRDLPLFGAELFRFVPSTFAPLDGVPVTDDYVIGPGDEVVVRAYGAVDIDWTADVDRNGRISLPRIGVISVMGVKYRDLQSHLKAAIGKVFRNFELTVTLGQLRSIQVLVVGQARRSGSFTVSSMSTLINAVFAAGGPSVKGSMRGIQLKRGNNLVTELDLYDLLISGDKSKDVQLLSGDVIYFPPVGSLVAISGSINVPAIYELKKANSLADLIAWSGGFSSTAAGQKVTLERIENRTSRKVDEYSLSQSMPIVKLRDGDLVTVYSVAPRLDNAVTLRGNVAQPARFPWRQGMRVKDLVPQTDALLSREYWLRRNQTVGLDGGIAEQIRRSRAAGVELSVADLLKRNQPRESEIAVMTLAESMRRTQISSGVTAINSAESAKQQQQQRPAQSTAAAKPGTDPLADPLNALNSTHNSAQNSQQRLTETATSRLTDEIRRNRSEVNWDYAVVERINPKDLTTTLVPFNLGKAILEGDPAQNLLLQPGDVVTIFSVDDIPQSISKQTKYVRLEGEFNSPGVYAVQSGETLRQLVSRVGGLAPQAYLFGAEFNRESTRIAQQKKLEEATNRLEREMQRNAISRSKNVVSVEEAAGLSQESQAQQALLIKLRQVKATGRIVLELPPDLFARFADLPDIPLEDSDTFIVPPRPSTVSVVGAVYNENAFVFKSEKRVSDYLLQAGGVSQFGDKNDVYVIRPDGTVLSKRQSGYFGSFDGANLLPGDTVVVPEEVDRVTWTRILKDYGQILYQFGLGAAALKVLKN